MLSQVIIPSVASAARIGLFGGTFDPIHYGHLRSAVELSEQYQLATLYMLPSHRPAHRGPTGAPSHRRIAMLEAAIKGADRLAVDSREALRDEPTYTVDTLREIREEQADATVVFFVGMDSFALFDTWHDWEGVLSLANLVVINRPGSEHSEFSRQLLLRQRAAKGSSIKDGGTGVIETCDVTQLAISATSVRRRIAEGLSVRFLLPDVVREYIASNNLYIDSE